MERYKTLVTTHYKEPGQDGQFDDCTKDVLEELCEDDYSDAEEEELGILHRELFCDRCRQCPDFGQACLLVQLFHQ